MKYILEIEKHINTCCSECPCLHIVGEEGYCPCFCGALNQEIRQDCYGIPKTSHNCPLVELKVSSQFVWLAWENMHNAPALVGIYVSYQSACEATRNFKDVLIEASTIHS